jgi:hypothetical protein
MLDAATIEACAKIAEKVGKEYGCVEERTGAFGYMVARAIRLLHKRTLDELLTNESALWVNGEFTPHNDIAE